MTWLANSSTLSFLLTTLHLLCLAGTHLLYPYGTRLLCLDSSHQLCLNGTRLRCLTFLVYLTIPQKKNNFKISTPVSQSKIDIFTAYILREGCTER